MPQKNHESPELVQLREKRDDAERKCKQAEHQLQRICATGNSKRKVLRIASTTEATRHKALH